MLTTLEIGEGATRRAVTLWQVTGLNNTPVPVWTDANGHFFAMTFGIGWLPDAYAGELQHMEQAQTDAMAAQAPILAKDLTKDSDGSPWRSPHVKIFDAPMSCGFLDDQTVVVMRRQDCRRPVRGVIKCRCSRRRTGDRGRRRRIDRCSRPMGLPHARGR